MTDIVVSDSLIHLKNDRISYVMMIMEGGIPAHLYFGAKLNHLNPASLLRRFGQSSDGRFSVQNCGLDRLPQEYPAYGLGDFREPAVAVRGKDGTQSVDLRFVRAAVEEGKPVLAGLPATFGGDVKTLRMVLRDEHLGLEAELLYSIFDDCDVIARSVLFRNVGAEALKIERAYSLAMDVEGSSWDLLTLSGTWAREREMVRRPVQQGIQGTFSMRGASSLVASPFLALLRPETNEVSGEVIAASLVYSGNFFAGVQVDPFHTSRVLLGVHSEDFSWTLEPDTVFQTPEAVLTWSDRGLNGMSRNFHRMVSEHLVRSSWAKKERPILLNNWEATYFDFNQDKLLDIARTAAKVGVELFVLDDGWFGRRDDDSTSLGDWFVDRCKLPEGLGKLSEEIHALGLKFGLWFEPEMISPESELFRAHPDWCIHISGREHITGRNQLILDLSRPEVCEYIYHAVADRLRDSRIDYIKWDMNRNFTNIGSAALPADRQQELPHRYMLGLYSVLERLNREFPEVLFESCASGGGRFDLGMIYYMPQTWCSDDTDAVCRCRIQYSTSLIFPPFAMGSHVSAVPNHQTGRMTPMISRVNVAMSGCFGFELDLNRLSDEELKLVEEQIVRVKSIRRTLLYGQFYRILSPYQGNDTSWMTVSQDRTEAVVMLLRASALPFAEPVLLKLQGLDPAADYRVEETGEVYGGDELMKAGLSVNLPGGDAASVSLVLRKLTE